MRALSLLQLLATALFLWRVGDASEESVDRFWPDRFTPFWNFPSDKCHSSYHVPISLDNYKIIYNKDFKFIGDKVITWYEYTTGLLPYYEKQKDGSFVPVNGGLPQKTNIAAHLELLKEKINREVPDVNFDGPILFDVEEWRPMYHQNWSKKRIYQSESQRLVRERHPSMSKESVGLLAEKEFNQASKKLLTLTIQLARKMRPKAKFSMYAIPLPDPHAGKPDRSGNVRYQCSTSFAKHNDRLRWLHELLDFLAPTIYLGGRTDTAANYRYVYATLSDTKRIADSFTPPKPILPYTMFEHKAYEENFAKHEYYNKHNLCNSLQLAADFGAVGVLIWSTDKYMTRGRCEKIAAAVDAGFGAAVVNVRATTNACAKKRCSGHGRCIRTQIVEECSFGKPPADYECACDAGYIGASCEQKDKRPKTARSVAANAGSGSGSSSSAVEPDSFAPQYGEEEKEHWLSSREAAPSVMAPVRGRAHSLWSNRISPDDHEALAATVPKPATLHEDPTHFSPNDNRGVDARWFRAAREDTVESIENID